MVQKNSRFVGMYEMSVRPTRSPSTVAPISLEALEALERLRAAVAAGKHAGSPIHKQLVDNKLYIIFDEMKIFRRKGYAAMLFTVADVDSADAVYRRIGSGVLRHFPKRRDEGGAISAHMVMKLQPEIDTSRYKIALEDVEGVSRSRVLPFLQSCLQTYCGPVTAMTDEGPRQGDPILEMDTVVQDRVAEAAGRPISAQLVRLRPRHSLDPDDPDGFAETSRNIVFKIDTQRPFEESVEALLRIRSRQQSEFQNYPLMRIRWKRPDNRTQTLSVDGLAEDLMQRAFTRMELIDNIRPDLPASMVDIREDFVDKIIAKL